MRAAARTRVAYSDTASAYAALSAFSAACRAAHRHGAVSAQHMVREF
ncbi:hypothetical protein [Streptomyces sp900116325]